MSILMFFLPNSLVKRLEIASPMIIRELQQYFPLKRVPERGRSRSSYFARKAFLNSVIMECAAPLNYFHAGHCHVDKPQNNANCSLSHDMRVTVT